MKRVVAVVVMTLASTIAFAAPARATSIAYVIDIPAVSPFPTTHLTFLTSGVLSGSQVIDPSSINVTFGDPQWLAAVTDDFWDTVSPGTYFTFTCDALSTSCITATGGAYTYELAPEGVALAPASFGTYNLNWYADPGIAFFDTGVILPDLTIINPAVPEPSSVILLMTGLAGIIASRYRQTL